MANFSSVTLCQLRAWISTFWMNQENEKKCVHCFLICKRHLYSRIEFSIELECWGRLFWGYRVIQPRQTSPGSAPGSVWNTLFWCQHLEMSQVFLTGHWGKCWKIVLFLLLNQICGQGQTQTSLCGIWREWKICKKKAVWSKSSKCFAAICAN